MNPGVSEITIKRNIKKEKRKKEVVGSKDGNNEIATTSIMVLSDVSTL